MCVFFFSFKNSPGLSLGPHFLHLLCMSVGLQTQLELVNKEPRAFALETGSLMVSLGTQA